MAERMHTGLGIGLEGRQRGEDHAGGAEHDRQRPGGVDAHAERRRRLVAGAGGHRHAGLCATGHLR